MSRRTTELLLLIAAAFPVTLLYALYVVNAGPWGPPTPPTP